MVTESLTTTTDASPDLKRAFSMLMSKNPNYTTLFSYADGNQPLKYSTKRLQDAFKDKFTNFNQNWIAVVVDSALDRLVFKGWSIKNNPTVNALLTEIFNLNQIDLEAYDVHKSSLITHEAYIIAWKDEEGNLEVYYNDPRLCHVFYEDENPKKKKFAAKWYVDSDNRWHMTLYYPEKLEYYETAPIKKGNQVSIAAFHPSVEDQAENPFKQIPVFHFNINRRSYASELTNIVTLQDAVNKLFADMMVAAEFGAWKQRYIISSSDTDTIKNGPNQIWHLEAADAGTQATQVGEFPETDLSNFLKAIDEIANSIAVISRTPKHYFYSSGSNVSGEALMAMEAPLIAKVERYQKSLAVAWRELGLFLLQLSGKPEIKSTDLQLVWEPAQSVQPLTEAQTMKTLIEAGFPREMALKWAGKSEDEIKEIMAMLDKAKKEGATQAQALLAKIKAEQDATNAAPEDNAQTPPTQKVVPNVGPTSTK